MRGGYITLPKAEVHVHLEGCFEIDDIVGLAHRIVLDAVGARLALGS